MSGDYSRFNKVRYTSVLMQQGRVQLDSDWNEQVHSTKVRLEKQALDTFGRCAVPKKTTPKGFEPKLVNNDLLLGAGRIWVDGKLAEIEEGETFKALPISYLNQPFLPQPPALFSPAIIYLDVWDREVTYLEDETLLEKALGGPDTTTRLQSVWQVKLHRVDNPVCGMDLDALFPASGARLSTKATQPPSSDDPCILAPTGGYRGLENRLYRVEVHVPGDLASARFKWSRDNASVATRVRAQQFTGTSTILTVDRIGRDPVLRFRAGDWVEVQDDVRELRGQAGILAQVIGAPDEANLTITLDRDLQADLFDPTDASRHTRIRRFDQQAPAGSIGSIGLAGGAWIALEDGVEVQFSLLPGTEFKVGDVWLFAARVADGSVEVLQAAKPRALQHHYCQLGVLVNGVAGVEVCDCRPLWPDCGCCCSIEVGDGVTSFGDFNDLAEALLVVQKKTPADQALEICVLPGSHLLTTTVPIDHDLVTLHGCGRGSLIVGPLLGPAFVIEGARVTLRDLRLEARNAEALIEIHGAEATRVEALELENLLGRALLARAARALEIRGNSVHSREGMTLQSRGLLVEKNLVMAKSAANAALPTRGQIDIRPGTHEASVIGNRIAFGRNHGISFSDFLPGDVQGFGQSRGVTIANNRIDNHLGSGIAVAEVAFGTPRPEVRDLTIKDNEIVLNALRDTWSRLDGLPQGGVVLASTQRTKITGNLIENNGVGQSLAAIAGLFCQDSEGLIVADNVVQHNFRLANNGLGSTIEGAIVGRLLLGGLEANLGALESWPAAQIENNYAETERGRALMIEGLGAVQARGNRLVVKTFECGNGPAAEAVGAAFVRLASLFDLPSALQFSGNQVLLQEVQTSLTRGRVVRLDAPSADLAFADNQVRCAAGAEHLENNTALIGKTTRALGNGVFEKLTFTGSNSFATLEIEGSDRALAIGNQTTHCLFLSGAERLPLVPNALNQVMTCGLELLPIEFGNLVLAALAAETNQKATVLGNLQILATHFLSELDRLRLLLGAEHPDLAAASQRLGEVNNWIQGLGGHVTPPPPPPPRRTSTKAKSRNRPTPEQ